MSLVHHSTLRCAKCRSMTPSNCTSWSGHEWLAFSPSDSGLLDSSRKLAIRLGMCSWRCVTYGGTCHKPVPMYRYQCPQRVREPHKSQLIHRVYFQQLCSSVTKQQTSRTKPLETQTDALSFTTTLGLREDGFVSDVSGTSAGVNTASGNPPATYWHTECGVSGTSAGVNTASGNPSATY
jgi:hypothetical protein